MTNTIEYREQNYVTMSGCSSEHHTIVVERFKSDVQRCPWCQGVLAVYKSTAVRKVITLHGPRYVQEVQLYCPSTDCPGRCRDVQDSSVRPVVVESDDMRTIVLPHMKYGLDVVIEVGTRWYRDPKAEKSIQRAIQYDYGLFIPLSTLYRLKDLFEDISVGIFNDHLMELSYRVRTQPIRCFLFDATQLKGEYKLYRAIDFLSGLCLGTLLVTEGGDISLQQWILDIIKKFGKPHVILTDGEAALHLDPSAGLAIPHQDCWFHVLSNIYDLLFSSWRSEVQQFLQKVMYRSKALKLQRVLIQERCTVPPELFTDLQTVLGLFTIRLPGRSSFTEPLAERLIFFKEARTTLRNWDNALRGQKGDQCPYLETYEESTRLKKQLTDAERGTYFEQSKNRYKTFFEVFDELKSLTDSMCASKTFSKLLADYQQFHKEFQRLHSWLLEAVVRRGHLASHGEHQILNDHPLQRVKRLIKHATDQAYKILQDIPLDHRAWTWRYGEPCCSLPIKAELLLDRIIHRWSKNDIHSDIYRKAAALLTRQKPYLLTFLMHPAIPVSIQALETDHGALKQLWIRSSGGQERPSTLPYHGTAASMARNFCRALGDESPAELLGIKADVIAAWYTRCSRANLQDATDAKTAVKTIRRCYLRARHRKIYHQFKESLKKWSEVGLDMLQHYVAKRGT